jgi:hypothetical protein
VHGPRSRCRRVLKRADFIVRVHDRDERRVVAKGAAGRPGAPASPSTGRMVTSHPRPRRRHGCITAGVRWQR